MLIGSSLTCGYYQTAGQKYTNKTQALLEATKHRSDIHWNFHDHVFETQDWTRRPQGTLKDLYKLRAQQIRDSYDYVIVHFSGGADSWTVLHSFLSNNIHVDEVYTRWARDERKYRSANAVDLHQRNLGSEYEYATEPVLKYIEKNFPQTRICVDDYSEAYNKELNENHLTNVSHYATLGTFHRFSRRSSWELEAEKKGKRIGVIYGFDKIQHRLVNGKFYSYFVDRIGSNDSVPGRTAEGFYWTPFMPEIPIMQSHDLKNYYQTQLHAIKTNTLNCRQSFLSICYPDYNINTFQVGKPAGSMIWSSEVWIHKHNPRYVKSWQWMFDQFFNHIDNKYFDIFSGKIKLGYKTINSNLYHVGFINNAHDLCYEFVV